MGQVNYIPIEKAITLEVGSWDMNVEVSKVVGHNINDLSKIRSVQILICNDDCSDLRDLTTAAGPIAGSWRLKQTNIVLFRTTNGHFDSTDYDNVSVNRGFIRIVLE